MGELLNELESWWGHWDIFPLCWLFFVSAQFIVLLSSSRGKQGWSLSLSPGSGSSSPESLCLTWQKSLCQCLWVKQCLPWGWCWGPLELLLCCWCLLSAGRLAGLGHCCPLLERGSRNSSRPSPDSFLLLWMWKLFHWALFRNSAFVVFSWCGWVIQCASAGTTVLKLWSFSQK